MCEQKRKPQEARQADDVTGFAVDEDSMATHDMDRWKEEESLRAAAETEQVMHAATNYVKKIPTKKEMRAQASAKVAAAQGQPPVSRSSQEDGGDGGDKPKKKGWGAVRGAVKTSAAFQQGRANKQDDGFKNRKKNAPKGGGGGGDEMGSFVIDRKKR